MSIQDIIEEIEAQKNRLEDELRAIKNEAIKGKDADVRRVERGRRDILFRLEELRQETNRLASYAMDIIAQEGDDRHEGKVFTIEPVWRLPRERESRGA
jgi:hypothetical protein